MAKVIVYTRPDGGTSVVTPPPGLIMEFHLFGKPTGTLRWQGPPISQPNAAMSLPLAEDAACGFVQSKDVPGGSLNVVVCDSSACPQSRRFRNAWRQVGTVPPTVDMSLARIQRMNEVRTERKPKLEKSDVNFLQAQERVDVVMQANLKIYRQKLRDLPTTEQPNVDACTTPEQLAAWNPTWPIDPV